MHYPTAVEEADTSADASRFSVIRRWPHMMQGGQVTISPLVKEGHQVMALFQLPSLINQYRSKADEYLSHLVGHEGKGSLLSALKAKSWASELSAGVGESGYDRNTAAYVFEVHITLTEAGLEAHPGV